ncbi:Tpo5p [Lachancea thermotolerans CBS 6340]|uniref:KLTH0F04576p n=1 Tax=Lachancea thermotolerans (strain ATCC 56472 / CBS 6340 / NRRL Y-8284) TaxID=559295 RepID=C5DKG9_LACTC|nr:KLTH0F04576p [Lachancea thermotolerans CBS 6340]CAR23970.1 KLTH0F04576p [Lachancea thermotolerans CBS 6340]
MLESVRTRKPFRDGFQLLPQSVWANWGSIIQDADEEEEEVQRFKYEQQLDRSFLSKSSVIGLGFGLMSPVLGMSTTMSIGLLNGGPLTIVIGFLINGIATWLCSLSLGEIVSRFPIELHGGSAMLARQKFKLACSWFTGWLMLLGNWTMSTSITFAGAQLLVSLVTMTNDKLIGENYIVVTTVLAFYLIVTIVGLINLKFAGFIETVNKVCVYWIVYAVIFIDILLLLFHSGKYRSLKYALAHFDNSFSGYSSAALSFIIGFQQSSFTLQGFSMLPALADEVKESERDIPKGMSTAVLTSTVTGVVFLLPIMLILPDTQTIINNPKVMPIALIFTQSTHSIFVSLFLVIMILGNLLFSGIGSVTTSSRAVYSMSRDMALPYSEFWSYVDPSSKHRVPKNSILLSMGISYLLGLLALLSTAAFNAFMGAAVLCLCSATCIPLVLVLISRRRALRGSPIKVRYRLGWFVNIASILWLVFTMVVICIPPQVPVTFSSMNYAFVVYLLFLAAITVLYFRWGRYNFKTPLISEDSRTDDTASASFVLQDANLPK